MFLVPRGAAAPLPVTRGSSSSSGGGQRLPVFDSQTNGQPGSHTEKFPAFSSSAAGSGISDEAKERSGDVIQATLACHSRPWRHNEALKSAMGGKQALLSTGGPTKVTKQALRRKIGSALAASGSPPPFVFREPREQDGQSVEQDGQDGQGVGTGGRFHDCKAVRLSVEELTQLLAPLSRSQRTKTGHGVPNRLNAKKAPRMKPATKEIHGRPVKVIDSPVAASGEESGGGCYVSAAQTPTSPIQACRGPVNSSSDAARQLRKKQAESENRLKVRRLAALARAQLLLGKILAGSCCAEALSKETWDDFVEQMVKAKKLQEVVGWIETARELGLGISQGTYERLLFAATARHGCMGAQTLWQIWELRCQRREGPAALLPKAACCALIRALGRQGEANRAELVFLALREDNGWGPQQLTRTTAWKASNLEGSGAAAWQPGDSSSTAPSVGRDSCFGAEPLGVSSVELQQQQQQERRNGPSVMAFNSIMEAFARVGDVSQVLSYYEEMVDGWGLQPNKFTRTALVQAFCEAGHVDAAMRVVREWCSQGFQPDRHIYSILMHWYIKGGRGAAEVKALKSEMRSQGLTPDLHTYSSLMQAHARRGKARACLGVLADARRQGLEPDAAVLSTAVAALGKQGRLEEALRVFSQSSDQSLTSSAHLWTARIGACSASGDLDGVVSSLDAMEALGIASTTRTLNAVLHGFLMHRGPKAALHFFNRSWSSQAKLEPNVVTLSILVNVYMRLGEPEKVPLLLAGMKEAGVQPDASFFRAVHAACLHPGLNPGTAAAVRQLLKLRGLARNTRNLELCV